MVISLRAIENWMDRKLRDCTAVKRWKLSRVEKELCKRGVEFHTDPYEHQARCLVLCARFKQLLLFLDMGLGKSKIMLDAYRLHRKHGAMLVLVPNVSNIFGWLDQVKLHAPDLQAAGVVGTPEERERAVYHDLVDVVVVTYAGLQHLVCDKQPKKRGKRGQEMVVNADKVRRLSEIFGFVVYDESTNMKNHCSLNFKVAKELAKYIPFRYALTGTPFGRDPQDLWAQFYAVDGGETLGPNITFFRQAFFKQKRNYWGGFEFTFKKENEQKLQRMMLNRSIRFTEVECLDLPERVYDKRMVILSEEAKKYYDKLIRDIRKSMGDYRLMQSNFIRMRQVTAGFVAMLDTEDERIEFELESKPKIEALIEWVEEVPLDRKMIIYHQYNGSGKIILDALKKAGHRPLELNGRTRKKQEVAEKFKSNKAARILVANESIAYGLNFQMANYMAFFESPVSPIVRAQVEKRLHRIGQKHRVFIYDFAVKGSVDETILKYLTEGEDLFEALVNGKVQL